MSWTYCRQCNYEMGPPESVREAVTGESTCKRCNLANMVDEWSQRELLINIIEELQERIKKLEDEP